jgi:hypothetical protein
MKREWKPGDVAMIPFDNRDEIGIFIAGGWVTRDTLKPLPFQDARPLVVIDPEDREQVERLCSHLLDIHWYGDTDYMQAALRKFANPTPPRPDEPMGLGAVVEDAEGVRWIRVTGGDATPWARLGNVGYSPGWRHWSDITAVRILSEGVS